MSTTLKPTPRKGYKGLAMEGFLARWYAKNTGKRKEEYQEAARVVASQVAEGSSVLEVAPGPGYLAIELARLGAYRVVGLDISHSFVQMATANAQAAGVAVTFHEGNASAMPFDANSFDFIVCRAAFKNFSEPIGALNEMCRVLKPGGKALILDLRPDASVDAINAHVKGMGLSFINSLLTKWIFKHMLLKRAYSREQFREMAAQTPFQNCEIQEDALSMAVSLTKGSHHAVPS